MGFFLRLKPDPMRIFVYEYLCAGGPGADSLRAEGWAMLSAVLTDLGRVPGVQLDTILDGECGAEPSGPSLVIHSPTFPEEDIFRRLAHAADFTLVIAPECDGLLWTRCRWVEEAGGRLLGPSVDAVKLTGDKLMLARHLQEKSVPVPGIGGRCFPAVLKPRDGAGSQATFLVRDEEELAGCAARAEAEGWRGELLLQPFVPGLPVSVALLLGPRQRIALPAATQELSADGRFRYQGGRLPLPPKLAERARALALRAAEAIPGLQGYVGVDLVLGESEGSRDVVIEINPRLTTSYVGLRALAESNLAEAMLDVVRGRDAALNWRSGTVHFRADGRIGLV